MMDTGPAIAKPRSGWTVAPNLSDYETSRAHFTWEEARRQLAGLPGGGLNIAHEAVDRHAAGPRSHHLAMRWLGRGGEVEDFDYARLKELSDRFADLGSRVQAAASGLPASTPTAAGDASPPGSGTAAPPAPKELYSQAYADYARGNYDLAIQEFQEFLKHYPNTDISDNAQYWVGKCLYGKQKFSDAVEAWNILLRDFPASDKLPDARVDKGLALEKLGRRSQALQEYRYVVDRYPNSPAARVARDKLNPQ